jgi:hypothetical protein
LDLLQLFQMAKNWPKVNVWLAGASMWMTFVSATWTCSQYKHVGALGSPAMPTFAGIGCTMPW